MAKSAEESRDATNENLKNMNLNQILQTQTQRNQKKIGIIGAVAGLIGAGGLVTAAAKNANPQKLFDAVDGFDPNMPIQKLEAWANSEKGAKAMSYVDATLRTYSDVRAYAMGTMIDQSMNRLNSMGVPQKIGATAGEAVKEFSNASGASKLSSTVGTDIQGLNKMAMDDVKTLAEIYKKTKSK